MLDNGTLLQVNRPGRYTGGEWNRIIKDWDKTAVKIALAYPEVYEIGMSNLAVPILYEILNNHPDVLAERVFAPWIDMATAMRSYDIPLYSLETKHPLKEFDIIGFSLGYELMYTNVLNILDLARIPLFFSDRNKSHPLIIAGGTCSLNPEPMADFIDAFIVGDGEEVLLEFLDVYRNCQTQNNNKMQLLRKLADIPGIYVPSFYQVLYQTDGLLKSVTPTVSEAKTKIQRRIVNKLPSPPTHPIVPYIEVIHDRGAIEIQRGCSRGCRFCQAGMVYRPVRERPHVEILQAVGELITNCGYDEVSLVSLNTSDYTSIKALITSLSQQYPHLALSLPSLRLDEFSVGLVDSLPTRKRTGLTFAPEAGSERLRRAINKNLTEDSLLETATTAFERGWNSLKLYFMIGLPTETLEDVDSIVRLVENVRSVGRKVSGNKPLIRVSVSTFVPKPHTPFQWAAQENEVELNARHEILRKGLHQKGTKLSWHDPKTSFLEAALSRGDRRLGKVIRRAWELGCQFDAWSENFHFENWLCAFNDASLDPGFYAHRERFLDEVLPWSHIDTGVTDSFLKREYQSAQQGEETPDCRHDACNACGLQQIYQNCRSKLQSV